MARAWLFLGLTVWAAAALWAGLSAAAAARPDPPAIPLAALQPSLIEAQLSALRSSEADGETAPQEAVALGAAALWRIAPLSDLPLALSGEMALQEGRIAEAEALLTAARERQPRRASTVVWLASAAVAQGETIAALDLLARLLILDRDHAATYLNAIAALVDTPDGRAWIETDAFRQNEVRGEIVRTLNAVNPDYGLLLALNHGDPRAQAGLINRALQERGPAVAFILWLSLLPDETSAAFRWPFNSQFEALSAPAPFNWHLHSSTASLEPDRGLMVIYSGRGRQVFASQLMLLRPGAYRFASAIVGDGQERGGAFVWQIACQEGNALLGETRRAGYRGASGTVETTFEVPRQGCDSQTLTLIGAPGEFPMRARATVSSVAITADAP